MNQTPTLLAGVLGLNGPEVIVIFLIVLLLFSGSDNQRRPPLAPQAMTRQRRRLPDRSHREDLPAPGDEVVPPPTMSKAEPPVAPANPAAPAPERKL